MKENIENNIDNNIKDNIKDDINSNIKDNTNSSIKSDIKDDTNSNIKNDIKDNTNSVIKSNVNVNTEKKKLKDRIIGYFHDIKNTPTKLTTVYMIFLAPLLVNLVIESLNKKSFLKCLGMLAGDLPVFIINYLIILFTISMALLVKKRIATIITISSVWIILGIVNFVVRMFRETPFSFTDIRLLGSVKDIIDNYLNPFSIILIIVTLCLVILVIVGLYIKLPKYAEKISYIRGIVCISIIFILMIGSINFGIGKGWISEKFPNMTLAYQQYGFSYCFANSIVNVGVKKPNTYSEESLEEIVNRIQNEEIDNDDVKTPNIIFLQLESFFDVNKMKDLQFSEDPIPNFNSLKDKYPSGFLSVNNVGYGTANTEFEIMTGMNLEDFGAGEFPYKTVLMDQTCESMSFILRDYGYSTHAIHNNIATFYARNEVFRNLGFDSFTSIEYMHPTEFTPLNWSKDIVLKDEIMKALQSTEETDYLYCISVQGHGSYPTEKILDNPKINVSGLEDESRLNQFEYYVNQINEMDDFIGQLVDELSNFNEDTVLVIYGDHLPSLAIDEAEIKNGNLYQTEYVIWSNFKLNTNNEDIETFELGSKVMSALGIDGGVINKFHQLYKGDAHYLQALKSLEYDILYGDMYVYNGQSPYVATDMKMGTYEIKINDVIKDEGQFDKTDETDESGNESESDKNQDNLDNIDNSYNIDNPDNQNDSIINENEDGLENSDKKYDDEFYKDSYIVVGENFTKYSVVCVNGELYDTEYIDENHLRVHIESLNTLDTFVVRQYYLGKTLSKTSDYIYIKVDIQEPETTEEIN